MEKIYDYLNHNRYQWREKHKNIDSMDIYNLNNNKSFVRLRSIDKSSLETCQEYHKMFVDFVEPSLKKTIKYSYMHDPKATQCIIYKIHSDELD